MRVPAPIKAVFDTFPLQRYPALQSGARDLQETTLFVHSLDKNGVPRDPRDLFVYLILLERLKVWFRVSTASPYMTASQELPLVFGLQKHYPEWFPETVKPGPATSSASSATTPGKAVVRPLGLEAIVQIAYPQDALKPETALYRSVIDRWLNDAWLTTVLQPPNSRACNTVYMEPMTAAIPWPGRRAVEKQLREYLDDRRTFDSQDELDVARVELALTALGPVADAAVRAFEGAAALGPVELLIYSYTRSIVIYLKTTPLALAVRESNHGFEQLVELVDTEMYDFLFVDE